MIASARERRYDDSIAGPASKAMAISPATTTLAAEEAGRPEDQDEGEDTVGDDGPDVRGGQVDTESCHHAEEKPPHQAAEHVAEAAQDDDHQRGHRVRQPDERGELEQHADERSRDSRHRDPDAEAPRVQPRQADT